MLSAQWLEKELENCDCVPLICNEYKIYIENWQAAHSTTILLNLNLSSFTIIQFKWRKLSSTVQYLLYANIDLYVSVCERDNSIKTQIKPEWMHWDGVFSFSLRRGYNLPLFWIFFFAKYTKRFFRCRSLQNKMNSFSWLVHFEFKSVYSSLSSVMSVRSGMVMDIRFYDNIKQFSAQIYLSLDFGTDED